MVFDNQNLKENEAVENKKDFIKPQNELENLKDEKSNKRILHFNENPDSQFQQGLRPL